MKKIILLIFFMLIATVSAQQLNYTWGQKTDGTYWNQTGQADADSSTTITIILDMQDFYPAYDFNPGFSDSSDVIGSSNKQFLGTFWYKIDAQNAGDSSNYYIQSYSGAMDYHPGDGSRVSVANIDYSSTATTLVDTSRQKGDVQWQFVNLIVNSSTDDNSAVQKHLPPEFVKLVIGFGNNAADSIDVYWNYAYIGVAERDQDYRRTSQSKGESRKRKESLH